MADPPLPVIAYDYSAFQQAQQGISAFPGTQLDSDLANLATSLTATIGALADIRRDDGKLQNGVVTPESLSPGLVLGTTTVWISARSYAPPQIVWHGESLYQCLIAHVATTFEADLAAGYWGLVEGFASAIADVEADADRAEAAAAQAELAKTAAEAAAASAAAAATVSGGIYGTRADATAASVPDGVDALRINGYTAPGDGGGALYRRAVSGRFQSADGAWWELAEREIDARMFGLLPGLEQPDAIAPANLAALQAAVDFVAAGGGGYVNVPGGISKMQPGLRMKTGVFLFGSPGDRWYMTSTTMTYSVTGTILLLVGSPASTVSVYGMTDQQPYGGRFANPDPSGVGNDTHFSLTNFYNSNAVGATAATPKNLSFGVSIDKVHIAGLVGIRVMLSIDGGIDYTNTASTSLGTAVDIGIFVRNAPRYTLQGVQTAGYFRVGGRVKVLEINANDVSLPLFQSTIEGGVERDCVFHGYRGVIDRATDVETVTAVTASTVQIPWHDSHFWPTAGKFYEDITEFTYTGLSFATDKLTFTGVTPAPNANGVIVGSMIITGRSFGSAPTRIENATIFGLSHQSGMPASRLGFDHPSVAVEISGNGLRKTYFDNVHVFDGECLVYGFAARDTFFGACHFEPLSQSSMAGGARDLGKKGRMIAANNVTAGWLGTYQPSAYAQMFFDEFCEFSGDDSVDLHPVMPRGTPWSGASSTGLFRPLEFSMGGKAPAWRVPFRQQWDEQLTISDGRGPITIPQGSFSGTLTIANDAAASITPPRSGGIIAIWAETTAEFPQEGHSGLVAFDTGSTPQTTKLTTNTSSFVAVSTNVTGTTGAVGETTVGVVAGAVKIENRQGATMTYRYLIMA